MSGPEDRLSPVDGLAQLSFTVHGLLEQRAGERDVSIVQTRLLGILRDRRPTMQQLAVLLGLDKSSVTGLVARAERRGLVARSPAEHDRRSVLVSLTEEGRRLVGTVADAFGEDVTALLAHLPADDRDALAGLISRLLVSAAADRGVDLFPPPDEEISASGG